MQNIPVTVSIDSKIDAISKVNDVLKATAQDEEQENRCDLLGKIIENAQQGKPFYQMAQEYCRQVAMAELKREKFDKESKAARKKLGLPPI